MPTVLLVRHGQASYGAAEYDVLSELGRRQARMAGAAIQRRTGGVKRVVTGSARRHVDTAAVLAELMGLDGTAVDARFDEFETDEILAVHGSTSLRLEAPEIAQVSSREFQAILDRALRSWSAGGHGSGEQFRAFLARSRAALDDVLADLVSGETAVVVTSAGVIAVICASLVGAPTQTFVSFNRAQVNTGMTKIVHGKGGSALVTFNDQSHLEDAGVEALLTYR